jgi:hypothetical protein
MDEVRKSTYEKKHKKYYKANKHNRTIYQRMRRARIKTAQEAALQSINKEKLPMSENSIEESNIVSYSQQSK